MEHIKEDVLTSFTQNSGITCVSIILSLKYALNEVQSTHCILNIMKFNAFYARIFGNWGDGLYNNKDIHNEMQQHHTVSYNIYKLLVVVQCVTKKQTHKCLPNFTPPAKTLNL